jgi:hypothetical protein
MALKLRRGTEAERVTAFVDIGEIVYVTDTKKVFVGDGATTGGILVGPVDTALFDVVSDTTPQLGGNLDLNGNNITGTGNISITGNITATGTINLGDGVEDNINVGGLINSSLNPAIDDSYNLGTSVRQWRNVWATQVNVDTTLAVGSQIIKINSGVGDSNLVLWDAETDTLNAREIIGSLRGNVYSDDSSTILLDGSDNIVSNGIITATGGRLISTARDGYFTNFTFTFGELDPDLDLGTSLILNEPFSDPAIQIRTVATSDVSKINFVGHGNSLLNPVAVTLGSTLGAISFDVYEPVSETQLPTALIIGKSDPNGTLSSTLANGKIEILTGGGSSSFVPNYLTFDSKGQLAINQQDASATLDVNGFAKLAVLTAAPASPANGMIAIADGTTWDPAGTGKSVMVVYLGGDWRVAATAP